MSTLDSAVYSDRPSVPEFQSLEGVVEYSQFLECMLKRENKILPPRKETKKLKEGLKDGGWRERSKDAQYL